MPPRSRNRDGSQSTGGVNWFKRLRYGQRIDLSLTEVWKFFPTIPPRRGEFVVIGDERYRVTRSKIVWDGSNWTITELWVKASGLQAVVTA